MSYGRMYILYIYVRGTKYEAAEELRRLRYLEPEHNAWAGSLLNCKIHCNTYRRNIVTTTAYCSSAF